MRRLLASPSCSEMSTAPFALRWTDYASAKALLLHIARTDVEDIVVEHHAERVRNHGAGGWKVVGHGLAVIYEHPDHDDATTARVITLWRRR